MANILVVLVLLMVVGAAVAYIRKEKKRGVTCIGCPQAGMCAKKNCAGVSGENISGHKDAHVDK